MPGCRWCRSAGSYCAIPALGLILRLCSAPMWARTPCSQDPLQIVRWFVQRWQREVTFRQVRDPLGVETQRQGSDKAIARPTPCLLGLFSIVTLLATRLEHRARLQVSAMAWYRKKHPTFSDTLAAVRRSSGASRVCSHPGLHPSQRNSVRRSVKASSTPSVIPPEGPNLI